MVSVGSILEGKVVSVMPFGAFVDIGNKQSGLVHISELSSRYVKDINDCVKKGDTVKVKVIKIDESGKISLSMKQAEEKKERSPRWFYELIHPSKIFINQLIFCHLYLHFVWCFGYHINITSWISYNLIIDL